MTDNELKAATRNVDVFAHTTRPENKLQSLSMQNESEEVPYF